MENCGISRWDDPKEINRQLKELTSQTIWEVSDDYYENEVMKYYDEKCKASRAVYEEAKNYDWVYRRTKYALEHFGEGDEAFEMLYKMDTDLKLHDGEWERAERDKRLKKRI